MHGELHTQRKHVESCSHRLETQQGKGAGESLTDLALPKTAPIRTGVWLATRSTAPLGRVGRSVRESMVGRLDSSRKVAIVKPASPQIRSLGSSTMALSQ